MKRTSRRTVLLKGGYMKRTWRRTVLLKGGDMKRTSRQTALIIDRNTRTIQLPLKRLNQWRIQGGGPGCLDPPLEPEYEYN